MNLFVEAIVAILQVGSVITLLYGLSLTVDNGLEKAVTVVAKLRKNVITRAKVGVNDRPVAA